MVDLRSNPAMKLSGATVEDFLRREVLRARKEIRVYILALEKETEVLLGEIVGGGGA